ncbi:MAG TPA: copper resistance protein CopC, partial [Candidatus Thermoplasmatota archaeon]|nr:copper resistance protein CopC [Candidatus Thermoplasmatota archaeon]
MARPPTLSQALALLALLALPGAAAHAEYAGSEPPQGARLAAAPEWVEVTLSERVDSAGTGLEVVDAAGDAVHEGDTTLVNGDRPTLRVALRPGLADGAYEVRWHAFSYDTHRTSGSFGFAVGPYEPPAATANDAGQVRLGEVLARVALYAGLALALGAAAFHAVVGRRSGLEAAPFGRLAVLGALLHAFGASLLLAATRSGTGLGWDDFLASDVGRLLVERAILALAALLLAAAWLWPRPRTRFGLPLVALMLTSAALGSARLGHASRHGVAGVALDLLHLLAAATWLGGLACLALVARRPERFGATPESLRPAGLRFSTLAMVAVGLVVLTGVATSLLILGTTAWKDPAALLGSRYGQALAGKVVLLGAMLALATVNRHVFLAEPQASGWKASLQRSMARRWPDSRPLAGGARPATFGAFVATEASVGFVVLLLAGVLTSVAPPIGATPEPGLFATVDGDHFHVEIRLDPVPTAGDPSDLRFTVRDLERG